MIAHVVFSVSYVAIVVRARLSGFDRSLEEAALDLGARPRPDLLAGHAAADRAGDRGRARCSCFTISIDDYVITSFVAGVGATTLPLQIYSMLKVGVTPEVNAVSTLLLAVTIVLIVIAQRLQQAAGRGAGRDVLTRGRRRALGRRSLGLVLALRMRPAGRTRPPYPGPGREEAQPLHLVGVPAEGGHRRVHAAHRDRGPLRPLRLERAGAREAAVGRGRLRPRRAVGLHGADPDPPEAAPAARPGRA